MDLGAAVLLPLPKPEDYAKIKMEEIGMMREKMKLNNVKQ